MAGKSSELAREESKALLAWADRLGLKRREIAEMLDVSIQRVSDYYKLLKEGVGLAEGDPIPANGRKVLRAKLEELEKSPPGVTLAYPSQKGAYTHDLLERLGIETGYSGVKWSMVTRMIEEALRQPKEGTAEGNGTEKP
jgi:transposase